MYRNLLWVLMIMACSCGSDLKPCPDQYIYTAGLCVVQGVYDIDVGMVHSSVVFTESAIENQFGEIEFQDTAIDKHLLAFYVDTITFDPDYMGVYLPEEHEIQVEASLDAHTNQELYEECVVRYYVLGHELMHFISHEIVHADDANVSDINMTHMSPNYFLNWCLHDVPMDAPGSVFFAAVEQCVEWRILLDVNDMCYHEYFSGSALSSPLDLRNFIEYNK